jgi:cell division protein FtsW
MKHSSDIKHSAKDRNLFILAIVLTTLGLIAVADASAPQALQEFSDKFYYVKQQLVWAVTGIIAMITLANIPYKLWEKIAVPIFAVGIGLLAVILIPGVTAQILGAKRWIHWGPVTIQPSEVIKLSLVIYLAKVSVKKKQILAFLIPLFIVCGLIMLEPDLGTTLIVLVIGLTQIFMSEVNVFKFIGAILAAGAGSFLLVMTSAYRRSRLMTFLQKSEDPLGKDYHIRQILFGLGSGGFWGVGLGQSRQKFLFLPESATDSILAVIAEEIGFIGVLVLIVLFGLFVYKGLVIAKHAPDKFGQILAVGITAWIGGQTLLNISAITALLPLTGVPLPFFSYGGSSLITVLAATGILLNISKSSYVKSR